jgi:hypothetical protein
MTKQKSKCLFKDFDLWRSGNGFLVRNAFIKIHDVEFENVTIEYLSVQGGIYSTQLYEQSFIEAINKQFIMENYKVI